VIWALLAILGVPIWLLIGVLVGIGLSRRAFKHQPGVFVLAVRAENGDRWPRRPVHARLVRDVLVFNRGLALLRTEVLAIDAVDRIDLTDRPKRPADAVGRLVELENGLRLELAVEPNVAERLDTAVAGSSDG
jgi:hypothetical protein